MKLTLSNETTDTLRFSLHDNGGKKLAAPLTALPYASFTLSDMRNGVSVDIAPETSKKESEGSVPAAGVSLILRLSLGAKWTTGNTLGSPWRIYRTKVTLAAI